MTAIKRTTWKEIRRLAKTCDEDITHYRQAQLDAVRQREGHLSTTLLSIGTYGINGKIMVGANTGRTYAITNRTPPMWFFSG